ncbi:MAG: T9SS type A sorting domain-containing protein [Bacteroidales bacterium]|nr:T9SS type A sorting domain-containing protein [Bacteroidales bacterium]
MKKFLLTIFVASFSFVLFGQVVLSDFDGTQMSGITITEWASFKPEVVPNPLKAGLNISNNVLFFPAHDFWYYNYFQVAGLLGFKTIDPSYFINYDMVRFKYLIQDTTAGADTVKIQLKLEKGIGEDIYSAVMTLPIAAGAVNGWGGASIAIPRNADNSPITHTMFDFLVSSNLKSPIPFYLDDITFISTLPTGLNPLTATSRLHMYQSGNLLNVKLEKEIVIKNLEIYNITGTLVKTYKFGYSTSEISVPADMASGCYIIRVNTTGQSMSQKFIKR